MESSYDAENVEGQLGIIRSQMGSNGGPILTKSRMEVKLGGWSRHPMPKMLKVS